MVARNSAETKAGCAEGEAELGGQGHRELVDQFVGGEAAEGDGEGGAEEKTRGDGEDPSGLEGLQGASGGEQEDVGAEGESENGGRGCCADGYAGVQAAGEHRDISVCHEYRTAVGFAVVFG